MLRFAPNGAQGMDLQVGRVLLPMAEGDAAFSQIVGRQFQSDFVARQNADTVAAQPAGQVGKNNPFMLQLNAEETAGKFLQNGAGYFNAVLFAHKPPAFGFVDRPGPRKMAPGPSAKCTRPP